MRSKSLLSLDEFCRFVGGDPWAFAGINRYGDDVAFADDIVLTAQYPYQRMPDSANDSTYAGSNSRQAVEQALLKAERLFTKWSGRHPVPVQVLQEEHKFPSQFALRYGNIPAIFMPKRAWVQGFGVSDGNYSGEPALQHEIRPLTVVIDDSGGTGNWTASIEGPAYLFVKPELYEIDPPEAIEHIAGSYVANVTVWVKSLDVCQQGEFIIPRPCSSLPCPEPTTMGICWMTEKTGYSPQAVTCTDGEMSKDHLIAWPQKIRMNYVAGFERENGLMAEAMVSLIAPLALGYLPFDEEIFEDFPTSPLFTSTAKYFREIQKWEQGRDTINPQVSTKFALAVPNHIQHMISGLEPRRGFVQTFGEILDNGWLVQTNGYTHK
jgi:hypothetical protein